MVARVVREFEYVITTGGKILKGRLNRGGVMDENVRFYEFKNEIKLCVGYLVEKVCG